MQFSGREWTAAFLGGAVAVATAASFSSLIAAGPLADALPVVLCAQLVCLIAGAVIRAVRGSIPFAIGGPNGSSTAILSAGATTLAAGAATHEAAVAQIGVVMAATAFAGAVTFTVMGRLRAGRIARYLPHPVVAGVLCGTGALMIRGSLRMTGFTPLLAVALVVAAVLLAVRATRFAAPVMVATIVAGSAATDGVLALLRVDPAVARAAGWLFPSFGTIAPSWLWWTHLGAFDGTALVTAAGIVVTAVIAVGLVTMFDVPSLELAGGVAGDLDTELRALGLDSCVTALLGGQITGLMGTPSMSARKAGARTRLPSLVTGGLALVALIFAGPVLGALSRPVLAGLLLATGAGIVYDWQKAAWRRLSRIDAIIVTTIAAVMVTAGFVPAVALGVVAACVAFVVHYSRARVVRDAFTLRTMHGPVERPPHQRARLDASGDRVVILRLDGYVFFGSAMALHDEVVARLAAVPPPDAILLDFTYVDGVDASAANGLAKAAQAARAADVALVMCALPADVDRVLARERALASISRVPTLQDALTDWEEIIVGEDLFVADPLGETFGRDGLAERARRRFTAVQLARSDILFNAGERADALYFVRSGRLDVIAGGARVRTLLPGTMVGEMAIYTGEPRSATIVAAVESVVERLSAAELRALTREDPEIADTLHRAVVRAQADRLRAANATIALGR